MMSNCYYLNSSINIKSENAKTEEEMKSLNLDEDFKQDSSNINKGYPILIWQ